MSEDHFKAFLEAVQADAGLQEKLKSACNADAVVAVAKVAGFVISTEQLKNAKSEVSEEELGAVVAGAVSQQTAQSMLRTLYPEKYHE